ncbi:phosphonate ABC transporter ATP-binding protein [Fundicoccus culcitae]|uniref:Phosphonate ABC transporter ATP-binding protein n=1 Tax=Fundicoccus culcitae TaxID=2969821 RepID=A0ABY5P2B9_9LACT|nr:phosphonate ABC transporter ATP-binding protein [Fundicoccus culcitae]UUX32746.1 phosphonate ABC transporter ATP-binding protein [Fundicoccus culcitae]
MNNSLLDIRHLTMSYDGKVNVLKDINLTFNKNEFVVVIGPSGAGKSTFIRFINLLVKPTGGEIIFDGDDLLQANTNQLKAARSNIGMIFQDYNLIERSNVLKNVLNGQLGKISAFDSIFGRFTEEDKQRAVNLLEEVGLGEHIYKRADELSGGQMQRVGICRALMQSPKLLLADEPIASLDPATSRLIMEYLFNLSNQYGVTSIVNLHQVAIAKEFATRIIGIKKGEVVFDDHPDYLTDDITEEIYGDKINESVFGTFASQMA